jgi:hypothetical protein
VFSSETGEQFGSFEPSLELLSDVAKHRGVPADIESGPTGRRVARDSAGDEWRYSEAPFGKDQMQDLLAYLAKAEKRRDAEMERRNQESVAKDLRDQNPPENS